MWQSLVSLLFSCYLQRDIQHPIYRTVCPASARCATSKGTFACARAAINTYPSLLWLRYANIWMFLCPDNTLRCPLTPLSMAIKSGLASRLWPARFCQKGCRAAPAGTNTFIRGEFVIELGLPATPLKNVPF